MQLCENIVELLNSYENVTIQYRLKHLLLENIKITEGNRNTVKEKFARRQDMKPELRFETKKMRAAQLGEESCIPDLLGEMMLQNNLKFELDEEDEIYEAYGRRATSYPYRQYNRYTRELKEKEVHTAVLENRYLRAVFLPGYGGRLWELWDKETGKNLLYTNDVLRFSNLAIRNAWFSGGVEWNIGMIGHHPFTTEQMYTAVTETDAGEPVLRMYEYERVRKVTYQMDFWLEEDCRFLNCRMRIVNESEKVVPMYWWSNMAVPEYENGRVIVPADKAFTSAAGRVYKVSIPYVNETDITDYKTIQKSVDYFFDIPAENPKYVANVDTDGYGLLQISTDRLRSRKLFSWGNQDASDRWQEFLTEDAGRYLEIQAGLGKTQYGCIPMAPHTAWEWMEQYGAVHFPVEKLAAQHEERAAYLTGQIQEKHLCTDLDKKLKATKPMAKKQAKLVAAGSGYGALASHKKGTSYLEFTSENNALKLWKEFFDTGILHCPESNAAPDEFLIDEENVEFLEQHMKGENEKNWYAHYHLGLGYYQKGDYKHAEKAFEASVSCEENPWALHGLSCVYLLTGRNEQAAWAMKKGMQLKMEEPSYLKEGFRILALCEANETMCSVYEKLRDTEKNIGKIKYYYILALHRLGQHEHALALLEENGGLAMDDVREGEDSMAQLWSELHEAVYGCTGEIPHIFNFKANE